MAGTIVGNAISNANQPRRVYVEERTIVHRNYRPAPVVNTYQREQNRQVQTALNYFGFPVGVPDGVMGRNSRAAVAQYQAYIGVSASGVLTEYDRMLLTSSYDRAIVGGPQVASIITTSGEGTRGLLRAFRQEQYGVVQPPVAALPAPVYAAAVPVAAPVSVTVMQQPAPVAAAAAPTPVPAPASAPEVAAAPVAVAPVVEVAAVATPAAGMPNFLSGGSVTSMASECNRVSITTSSNGGYVSVANMSNPGQALSEQFCLARTHAIEQGESLAATVQGFSMAEMQEQCEAFAPTMREYQARLSSQGPDEASAGFSQFVVGTGAQPAQLSVNARICLGLGYRLDNSELAVASAMVLVGLGEQAYGELLSHHLMNGYGVAKRPDLGLQWLDVAVNALAGGATPLVTTGGAGRVLLLEQAMATLNGGAPGKPVIQDASATGPTTFVLPVQKTPTE